VYVDDDTTTDTTDTTDDTYSDDSTDTSTGDDELTVEIDGEEYTAEENVDLDEDGQNDAAVVETEDGYVAFADTDADGVADVAVEYDADGNPVAGAEYDESTGEWTAEDVESLPTPTGDGAGDADGSGTDSTDATEASTEDTTDTSASGESMVVDMPGNEDIDAGPATYDTDADGVADTSVVTDADGTTYAFTDTDQDGEADQAVIIESDGDVTVSEETGDGEWTVTEEGHIGADGTYTTDGGSASSDAVWADR
jgi:hypothetical protein